MTSADGYVPLVCFNEHPVIMLKEDVDQKILMMLFSMHYSNFALQPDFPVLLKNVVEHFFPVTLEDYVYEVNTTIGLTARANTLDVSGPETDLTLESFPAELMLKIPGTYSMTQFNMAGLPVIENIFVKIPAVESDIHHVESTLTNPYFFEETNSTDIDLLFYFALAVVALLFIEWWLKSREQA